jgi:hypothetical protein
MSDKTEESVGSLTGPAAIERVFTQEETKVFSARAVLAYLDGPVFDFGACSVAFVSNPLTVFSDEMRPIGYAAPSIVTTAGGRRVLAAEVTIDYATEERLLVETGEALYPRVFGTMKIPGMALLDFQQRFVPLNLRIDGIQLSRRAPADERIVPFGKPVLL